MAKAIVYISFTRFPAEKAHSLYMAKVCDSFAAFGHGVELWIPRRFGILNVNPYEFYRVKNFKIRRLLCLDLLQLPIGKVFWHKLGVGTFALSVWGRILLGRRDTIYFTNDVFIALIVSLLARQVVLEIHDYPNQASWLYRNAIRRSYKILTNNHQKVDRLQHDFGTVSEKIIAVHNGVSIEEFDVSLSQAEARQQVDLELGKRYVLYTGHLYDWKGADVLAEAAKFMPEIEVLFVGGTETDVQQMREQYSTISNVHLMGHKPHEQIPVYLQAADILVLPNSGKHDLSRYHTSPMKLFEYMASKKPIVASDLPSIRELLSEDSAILVSPDEPQALAVAIKAGLTTDLTAKVDAAFERVQGYTWTARTETILQAL